LAKIDDTGIFKRCSCTVPVVDENGQAVLDSRGRPKRRELGKACPQLEDRNHGTWWFQLDIEPAPGSGKTRQRMRRGGHANKTQAAAARDKYQQRSNAGQVIDDQLTVGEFLDTWLKGKRKIRKGTLRSYTGHVQKYLKPYLGRIKLEALRVHHVRAMFDAIDEHNAEITAALELAPRRRRGEHLKKDEKREPRRVAGPATQQRIRATLRTALNAAIREGRITVNVASHVELESGKPPKALIWTAERVARWQETGEKPSPVMVWTPQQTGKFLDYASATKDHLYSLYLTIAFCGLRRGEACGLRWVDVDPDAGTITISEQLTQNGWEVDAGEPKSDAGGRVINLAADLLIMLKTHRQAQRKERLRWGTAWVDSGRVFTQEDGAHLIPDTVSDQFRHLAAAAGQPPIRLHDLRHGAATLALEAGVDVKVVQEMLGHSSSKLTRDTYTSVSSVLMADASEKIAALIPRAATGTETPPPGTMGTVMAPAGPSRGSAMISKAGKRQVKQGGPPGDRTPNPRIKSPLLCQLS
jgi:integrase